MATEFETLVAEARKKLDRISRFLQGNGVFCGNTLAYDDGEIKVELFFWKFEGQIDCDFTKSLAKDCLKYLGGFTDIIADVSQSKKDMRLFTTYIGTKDNGAGQGTAELNLLVKTARGKLDAVAGIFNGRDEKTTATAEVHTSCGKVFCRMHINTDGEPFEKDMERQLIISNLELQGGFTNIAVAMMNQGHSMLVRAVYDGQDGNGLRHGEHTLADLMQLVKDHRKEFPNGLLTKVSLADYEGNTFHSEFSAREDGGQLHLSFELNEG